MGNFKTLAIPVLKVLFHSQAGSLPNFTRSSKEERRIRCETSGREFSHSLKHGRKELRDPWNRCWMDDFGRAWKQSPLKVSWPRSYFIKGPGTKQEFKSLGSSLLGLRFRKPANVYFFFFFLSLHPQKNTSEASRLKIPCLYFSLFFLPRWIIRIVGKGFNYGHTSKPSFTPFRL